MPELHTEMKEWLVPIIDCLTSGLDVRVTLIMRGCFGSGKTTMAFDICDYVVRKTPDTVKTHVCSIHDCRGITGNDSESSKNDQLYGMVLLAFERDVNLVIVDNDNIKERDFQFYQDASTRRNYTVRFVEFLTPTAARSDSSYPLLMVPGEWVQRYPQPGSIQVPYRRNVTRDDQYGTVPPGPSPPPRLRLMPPPQAQPSQANRPSTRSPAARRDWSPQRGRETRSRTPPGGNRGTKRKY